MKESIIIRNFGPIKDIEIEDIRPFTIFIGESGSGKSTVLKVLALFRWIFKMASIRSYLKLAGISNSPFKFDFKKYVRNGGYEAYISPFTEIIYTNGDCVIKYSNKTLKVDEIIDELQLSLEKICFVTDKRNIIPDIKASKVSINPSSFFLNETWSDYRLATIEIQELELKYLGVKFVVKKTSHGEKHLIESLDNDNPFSINLEDASSGTQTVTPLSVIVEYFSQKYDLIKSLNSAVVQYLQLGDNLSSFRSTSNIGDIKQKRVNIHIEEPELSLYPESQRSLINYLVSRCFVDKPKDYDMTLMMATHSPYIINHINLLILAGKKEILEDGAQLAFEDVDVFEITDGYLNNLKRENSFIIDARPLSEPISNIYERYNELSK